LNEFSKHKRIISNDFLIFRNYGKNRVQTGLKPNVHHKKKKFGGYKRSVFLCNNNKKTH